MLTRDRRIIHSSQHNDSSDPFYPVCTLISPTIEPVAPIVHSSHPKLRILPGVNPLNPDIP